MPGQINPAELVRTTLTRDNGRNPLLAIIVPAWLQARFAGKVCLSQAAGEFSLEIDVRVPVTQYRARTSLSRFAAGWLTTPA